MSGTYSLTISEARGYVAIPADLDSLAVVMGVTSAGAGQSDFYLSGASAVAGVGYGDAVDTLTQIIEQRQSGGHAGKKLPAAIYSTGATVPATYGTIDLTGFTGLATVAVDAASLPYGTYNAGIRFITGGIVGVAGITYQTRLDYGNTWSRTIALGTASSITIANSRVKFDLTPATSALTDLNTLLNEVKTDFNAHVIVTAGTVHTNSGVADVVATTNASNTATRIALANALRLAMISHFGKGSTAGTPIHINVAGDTAGIATLSTTPAATSDVTALQLALVLKTVLNLHGANVVVHTIADATNVVTSATPTAGSVNAGDAIACRTFAPAPDSNDIDDAFAALAAGSAEFTILVLDFPLTVALAAHVTTGLNMLAAVGRDVLCLARYRLPHFESSETETAWGDALKAEFAIGVFDDSRIHLVTEYGLLTDAVTTRQYLRSGLAQVAADVARVPRIKWFDSPSDQKMANFTLINSSGVTIGHDEGPSGVFTGLSNDTLGNRFGCVERLPDATRRQDVYTTVPWVLYATDERIRNVMVRRMVNALKRVIRGAAVPIFGGDFGYTSTGPSTGILTDASREAIQGSVFQAVSAEFSTEFLNAQDAGLDTGLIQIDPAITLSGGDLIGFTITSAPKLKGYAKDITVVIAVEQ